MVREGWAWWYRTYAPKSKALEQAKAEKKRNGGCGTTRIPSRLGNTERNRRSIASDELRDVASSNQIAAGVFVTAHVPKAPTSAAGR